MTLARAIYANSDIVLLDDPLSAVDIHVGTLIVKECLQKYLKNKTRIVVTHALAYLKYFDYIYIMHQGEIAEQGNYEQIQQSEHYKEIQKKIGFN